MDAKIKWSLFVFNTIFCMTSGCTSVFNDCYYDVNCDGTDYIDFNEIKHVNEQTNCSTVSIYRSNYGYEDCIPVRIKIESENVLRSFMFQTNTDLINSLEIINIGLTTAPYFNEMTNLKSLSLSKNHLEVAKLFNQNNLNVLENIDLSHNYINSIQVDSDQYVYTTLRTLNLSHNMLTYITGGIFEPFKYLENLNLSNNNIAVIDHYTFEGLKTVKYLYLSYNNISEISVSLLWFSDLDELYLDHNNIKDISTRNFDTLKKLQKLRLEFNKISSIQKDTFSKMDALTTLNLQHNLLSDIRKDVFLSTNNLTNIDLSHNLIKNLPKDLFLNKNITSFSIVGNNVEGAISKGTFEGLQLITELDVSFQGITAIEEFTFFGLAQLTTLLLNNNAISIISEHSFSNLVRLKQLDLSNNLIVSIDFDKRDLLNLEIFSLGRNLIKQILDEDFQGLNSLRVLDLSYNNISKLETSSFKSIETVESLQLFNNPIKGDLTNNIFDGFHLVFALDLSHASITSIKNGSFSGMAKLEDLNVSRNSINKLEYSAFMNTGNIKSIDLSFNKLTDFFVNGNNLRTLTVIYLNNNAILKISNYSFKHMVMLNKIIISYNLVHSMSDECFVDQTELRYLDVSYNNNLTFHISTINKTRSLEQISLSGVKSVTDFTNIVSIPVKQLVLSHSTVQNISLLHLNSMSYLTDLVISNNNIAKIEFSALKNMSALELLDLSFNNISFIQPGTFRDNVFLYNLNLSHNSLTSINHGIFRGLVSLKTLNITYNSIRDLGRERFYDTQNLKTLIADNNKITGINVDFVGINLELLSIGHNPIPCDQIISLKRLNRFKVSAINIDETNGPNIDGITCKTNDRISEQRTPVNKFNSTTNDEILVDIQAILLKMSESRESDIPPGHDRTNSFTNLSEKLDKYGVDQIIKLKDIKSEVVQLKDIRVTEAVAVNGTNLYLERILKGILSLGSLQNRFKGDSVNNGTSHKISVQYVPTNTFTGNYSKVEALVSDVNQVKQEVLHLENVLSEIDRKISLEETLMSDKLNDSGHNVMDKDAGKSVMFLDVFASLILLMFICFFMYKFYDAKIMQQSRSLSTRHITDAMDNSNPMNTFTDF